MKLSFLGAGAWGTALAVAASRSHEVTLWGRDAEQMAQMRAQHTNQRYLPKIALPPGMNLVSGPVAQAVQEAELVVVGTPMSALRETLTALASQTAPVAWLCKGFETGGCLGHEIARQVVPHLKVGALSGPSFAKEVALGLPTALVAAACDAELRGLMVSALHSAQLRVYASEDLVGVEVGGAVKNVLAIATGLCDGMSLGLNARAALITRGLAEMTRLGQALGAQTATFMGLSGLGDLVLTATGDLSRNRQVGLLLAQGQSLDQALASLGHVAEGVYSAHTVLARARALGVDMPIAQAVVALLEGECQPQEAVAQLMGREPKLEQGAC
jgi:glycerol-3-phosphate dehydrogenase (NAD(P)+)